ncbi:MAG: hypothetical protein ACOVKS_03710 [Aquimonas sp.]
MPLEPLVDGLLKGAVRLVIEVIVEVVENITFRGTGGVILSPLRPRSEPADTAAIWAGALIWMQALGGLLVPRWAAPVGD